MLIAVGSKIKNLGKQLKNINYFGIVIRLHEYSEFKLRVLFAHIFVIPKFDHC